MSVSEVFLIIFLIAVALFLFGFFPVVMAIVAGIAAIVCAVAKLAKQ